MLKIPLHPEPDYFDSEIRSAGEKWRKKHPKAPIKNYPAYWTEALPDLADLYQNICCYYCLYIEPESGAGTIDHFEPKSLYPEKIYEWNNFRFCCLQANRRKSGVEGILDPIQLPNQLTFQLDLIKGEVYSNADTPEQKELVEHTIKQLKLNNPKLCEMRKEHYNRYLRKEITRSGLKKFSPFVYLSAKEQNML